MAETLCSVGLDVGTTSTQMVVSRLTVENRAGAFSVPDMAITRREIRYRSPIYETPLMDADTIDGDGLKKILEQEYENAGISSEEVDTGAVIITGETARKENARRVAEILSEAAGKFVVTAAGPDLESILAAKGGGALDFSEKTGQTLLHMDIGGGTANLCRIRAGQITATGCLNVGGRLLRFGGDGVLTYVSPVLKPLTCLQAGDRIDGEILCSLARQLTEILEMAAGLRPPGRLLELFATQGSREPWKPEKAQVLSFSGGVADCMASFREDGEFGDLGPALGRAIRESALCRGNYRLGAETIRATVIGAGCHSTRLSGSTVFLRHIRLPCRDLRVVAFGGEAQEAEDLPEQIKMRISPGEPVILALPGWKNPDYGKIQKLARAIAAGFGSGEIRVCLREDMAKALGQALAALLPPERECLCLDGLDLGEGSFLDVGEFAGAAVPVVIRTLIFGGTSMEA